MPKWQELEGTAGEGNGNPLQFSHLEKSHGQRSLVGCSPWGHDWETSLSLFLSCIGGGNATPSSILAWKIPWTEEPGRLQSMGLLSVGHDWATLLSLFTFMHWRRKWQPTPVFLPGESQGQGAWWATIYGVAQSQTRLKQPSSSSSSHMERNEKECPRDQNMGINIGLYIVKKNLQSRPSVEYWEDNFTKKENAS